MPYFSHLLCFITLVLLPLISLSPVSCLNQLGPLNSPKVGMYFEGKERLGSKPPSCHNKCNQCHPCTAAQIPTLPSHDRFRPGFAKTQLVDYSHGGGSGGDGGGGHYSNYKPLGWKCHCRDHFYNP